MGRESLGPVCVFLIPVVRDSDRKPHAPILWRLLQDAILQTFGAVAGPETVVYYRSRGAVPGAWSPRGRSNACRGLEQTIHCGTIN